MIIKYFPKFAKEYRNLDSTVRKKLEKQLDLFRIDQFDSRLKTHALTGALKGLYSFLVDRKFRVLFEFNEDKTEVVFLEIGSHDIYK